MKAVFAFEENSLSLCHSLQRRGAGSKRYERIANYVPVRAKKLGGKSTPCDVIKSGREKKN